MIDKSFKVDGKPMVRLVVLDNGETHIQPLAKPFTLPIATARFVRRLRKERGKLYAKHAVTDTATPRFNRRFGFKEVRRDHAFVYYEY